MARHASRNPTELELEILKIIWRDGPSSVRDIAARLAPKRKLAITTIQTVVVIMIEKGYLKRAKEGGNFVYRARITEAKTARSFVRDLAMRVFGGSTMSMISNALEVKEIDRDEITKIRAMLDAKEGKEA